MFIKIIIVLMLFAILVSLGVALVRLIRDPSGSEGVLRALTFRIGLSIALFILLMIATALGLITPNNTPLL